MGTAETDVHRTVRDTYAQAACCAPEESALADGLYDAEERASLPDDAVAAALGCANPAALAALQPGERVLDLGSGGGIDVLLSARRVGPAGFAFGLDMTPEMLTLAERNRADAGLTNVQFLRGRIEDIPLPADAVDVVLSNCVVNLSPDKRAVFSEALRVLRPGGRLAIADIATRGPLPPTIGASLAAWAGCIAGALDVSEIETMLADVGFAEPAVEVVRAYGREDLDIVASSALAGLDLCTLPEAELDDIEGRLVSVFIRGRKPGA